MTRRNTRLALIASGGVIIAAAVALVFAALGDTVVYFHSPSEIAADPVPLGKTFRIGGMVKDGSVRYADDGAVEFTVTDYEADAVVRYRGELPALFREGQGVVAEGGLIAGGVFKADKVLAKHDETYMPPEVAKSLKAKETADPAPVPAGS